MREKEAPILISLSICLETIAREDKLSTKKFEMKKRNFVENEFEKFLGIS